MGKKKGSKPPRSKVSSLPSAVESEDDEAIEQRLQSILEDEIDQYNAQKDKVLLDKGEKIRNKKSNKVLDDEEEEEVYGLGLTSEEEEEEEGEEDNRDQGRKDFDFDDDDMEEDDDDDDDIMDKEETAGIPDSRAWGKKVKTYHNTDYVDQDFGGFEGSDAEMAEQEEAEAKEIQKRLTAELDESDFLGLVPIQKKGKGDDKKGKTKEVLKLDFDKLSIPEKRRLVERECPEVIHMLHEYTERLKEARQVKKDMVGVTEEALKRFYQSKYHTLLNYCINISYYLYLRSTSPTDCKGHPVIKRILQFRRLLDELTQFDPTKYVAEENDTVTASEPKKKDKKKKIKTSTTPHINIAPEEKALGDEPYQFKFGDDDNDEDQGDEESQEKRKITYAIAKNKGLTPKRKKEQRNPRVKHREKFRKAKIRRRGQVRTPRTEIQRYEGETSGIKAHLTRSVKLR